MHCGQNTEFLNVEAGGTHNNHWAVKGQISVIKTSQLMLYREIIADCSEIHAKRINALWTEHRMLKLVVHIITPGL